MLGWLFGGFVKDLERSARKVSQEFTKSARQDLSDLFDEKVNPLADKLDYIAQARIKQSRVEMEALESKTKADIESLLNNAQGRAKQVLAEVNQVREAALRDVQETIGQTVCHCRSFQEGVYFGAMQETRFLKPEKSARCELILISLSPCLPVRSKSQFKCTTAYYPCPSLVTQFGTFED